MTAGGGLVWFCSSGCGLTGLEYDRNTGLRTKFSKMACLSMLKILQID